MTRLLFILLSLGLTAISSAADKTIQIEWTFLSSPQPLALEGLPIPSSMEKPGFILLNGVLTPDQMAHIFDLGKSGSAHLTTLDPARTFSGNPISFKSMKNMSATPTLAGDFQKYGQSPPKHVRDEKEVGYRLICTPKLGPDGETIDLDLQMTLCDLVGFHEYFLTNSPALPPGSQTDPRTQPDFPRVRVPAFSQLNCSTQITIYDGQSLMLTLGKSSDTPNAPREYAFVTVHIVPPGR
ncbi:hypothetical protein BH09VER1_BH09VER1_33240 [soil metagenome]